MLRNRLICVITLAGSHPVLQSGKTIQSISYQISTNCSRLQNKVSGKFKRPSTEGYIAVVLPKFEESKSITEGLLTQQQYEEVVLVEPVADLQNIGEGEEGEEREDDEEEADNAGGGSPLSKEARQAPRAWERGQSPALTGARVRTFGLLVAGVLGPATRARTHPQAAEVVEAAADERARVRQQHLYTQVAAQAVEPVEQRATRAQQQQQATATQRLLAQGLDAVVGEAEGQ
ncbi:hypothetical protein A6R68_10925 [Neotoma lepida]|uniref:Uncharacterized protein n=1 Tax=Neotoma lepida TaxID=56216 RepID=A0A1A6FWN2_NEOLE|nr:hypothetical protein A6R68_10925 [Neotoma lepida]